jgi:hypothetical protein
LFIYSLIQISFNSFLCLQAAVEALCLAEKMGLTNTSEGKRKEKKGNRRNSRTEKGRRGREKVAKGEKGLRKVGGGRGRGERKRRVWEGRREGKVLGTNKYSKTILSKH